MRVWSLHEIEGLSINTLGRVHELFVCANQGLSGDKRLLESTGFIRGGYSWRGLFACSGSLSSCFVAQTPLCFDELGDPPSCKNGEITD